MIFPGGPIRLAALSVSSPSVGHHKADPYWAGRPGWGLKASDLADVRCPRGGGIITRSRLAKGDGRRRRDRAASDHSRERRALILLENAGYEAEGFGTST